MYAYSFYLFFDFAGYSAFAIGLSYLLGMHVPENFDRPFLARNIRDFWNRWHITLSFWFRDHIYMRFLLAATRGKWFAHKDTAAILGYFLTFGLMGLWHGIAWPYIAYGFYQATLLSGFHLFVRWNKTRRIWGEGRLWHTAAVALTFQCVCFGLLIFSGHIGPWLTAQPTAQVNRRLHQICHLWPGRQRIQTTDPRVRKRNVHGSESGRPTAELLLEHRVC
jgi:membrane protein involved in D-alanine export